MYPNHPKIAQCLQCETFYFSLGTPPCLNCGCYFTTKLVFHTKEEYMQAWKQAKETTELYCFEANINRILKDDKIEDKIGLLLKMYHRLDFYITSLWLIRRRKKMLPSYPQNEYELVFRCDICATCVLDFDTPCPVCGTENEYLAISVLRASQEWLMAVNHHVDYVSDQIAEFFECPEIPDEVALKMFEKIEIALKNRFLGDKNETTY